MLTVADIWDDAKTVFGTCTETKIFERINDAIDTLSAKGDWDPALAWVDIAVNSDKSITFPAVVEVPLAVNLDGVPALGRDRLFEFHLNGPGARWSGGNLSWRDGGLRATMVDLPSPAEGLAVLADLDDDAGVEFWVYGVDESGAELRTEISAGVWQTGLRLVAQQPSITSYSSVKPARIDRVSKPATDGRLRLYTSSGALLGEYQHDDVDPRFRRIVLNQSGTTARVFFRRKQTKVATQRDWIPLPHRYALKLMLQSLQAYDTEEIEKGLAFEAQATRMTQERNARFHPPTPFPMQIDVQGGLSLSSDDDIR